MPENKTISLVPSESPYRKTSLAGSQQMVAVFKTASGGEIEFLKDQLESGARNECYSPEARELMSFSYRQFESAGWN